MVDRILELSTTYSMMTYADVNNKRVKENKNVTKGRKKVKVNEKIEEKSSIKNESSIKIPQVDKPKGKDSGISIQMPVTRRNNSQAEYLKSMLIRNSKE